MASMKKIGKDKRVITCEKVNVRDGFTLLGRFTKIIAPFTSLLSETASGDDFFKSLEVALVKINWSDNIEFMSDLVELCKNEQGLSLGFETDVSSMTDAVEIVMWVVEVQFGSFFAESPDLFKKIAAII